MKYAKMFEYLRQCPLLADMWSIAAIEDIGVKVIIPLGASEAVEYSEAFDVNGNYECDIIPFPSVYEDYQINCYVQYDDKDSSEPRRNLNVLNLEEVQAICDWVSEQDDKRNFPDIGKVISIECNPFVPQVRFVNEQEGLIAYFITVRVRYVNPKNGRSVFYEN